MLPLETFKTVIASTPLLSIDMIVRNNKQEVLLGRRINKPAQGFWFVPGGRILKGETLELAFKRLLKAELNIVSRPAEFKGVYQHFYDDNMSGNDFGTHYVVLAYEIQINDSLGALPNEQHGSYKWLPVSELLKDECVHKHTKWYFQKGQSADASFEIKELKD
jgi:colanic acid biosynthesis protein WcaH